MPAFTCGHLLIVLPLDLSQARLRLLFQRRPALLVLLFGLAGPPIAILSQAVHRLTSLPFDLVERRIALLLAVCLGGFEGLLCLLDLRFLLFERGLVVLFDALQCRLNLPVEGRPGGGQSLSELAVYVFDPSRGVSPQSPAAHACEDRYRTGGDRTRYHD